VLNKLAKCQVTELDIALEQLTIGAAFFACHSCKYSTVPRREEKCTKLLCLQNIRFFRDGHLISVPSADLESADSVATTFEMQKNDMMYNTVIHGRMDNPVLCPSCNRPKWSTEFELTQTRQAIHRYAQFGAMADSTRLHQCKCY
jgi:hypothetical protein